MIKERKQRRCNMLSLIWHGYKRVEIKIGRMCYTDLSDGELLSVRFED